MGSSQNVRTGKIYNAGTGSLYNRSLVLKMLFERRDLSRAEIAKLTGLTRASVTNIMKEFIENQLVEEVGSLDSGLGRKRKLLRVKPDAFYYIGVEIERSTTKIGIFNTHGKSIGISEKPTLSQTGSERFVEFLLKQIDSVIKMSGVEKKQIFGIGIGVPGPIDSSKGIVKSPNNFPSIKNLPLKNIVEDHFNIETWIGNDANCAALGEKWFGLGKKYSNYVFLTSDLFGLGSGVVLDGKLYEGKLDTVGEVGYNLISLNGSEFEPLERYTNINRIIELYEKRTGKTMKIEDVLNGNVDMDDPEFRAVLSEVGRYLSVGVLNITNYLGPEAIIIGGRLLNFADIIIEEIEKMISKHIYASVKPIIVLPTLEYDAGVVGAASLVIEKLIAMPEKLFDLKALSI